LDKSPERNRHASSALNKIRGITDALAERDEFEPLDRLVNRQ
jgi:hypothetical protein